jgi:hypothetical protein
MDFSLLQTDENFRLENYFDAITAEFPAFATESGTTQSFYRE